MTNPHHNILLADDDIDDCTFFADALLELPLSVTLSTVNDGVELMNYLKVRTGQLPDVLFLDLNMPRKSGIECLSEIKSNNTLQKLPVIIFSTSLILDVVDLLYHKGAQYYIRKPGEYEKLKKVISEAVSLVSQNKRLQPSRDSFILHS